MSRTKSNHLFQFKLFAIAQDRCAMKVGTDAVLLATLPKFIAAHSILDIGTGTGVLSLMLAQQFPTAQITALEIEESAAMQAAENFANAKWSSNIKCQQVNFETFESNQTFDLIITNPPYFIDALKSTDQAKNTARHATTDMLNRWLAKSYQLLSNNGKFSIILPASSQEITEIAIKNGFFITELIDIHSFEDSPVIRQIFILTKVKQELKRNRFWIYKAQNEYSDAYIEHLKPYLTIF